MTSCSLPEYIREPEDNDVDCGSSSTTSKYSQHRDIEPSNMGPCLISSEEFPQEDEANWLEIYSPEHSRTYFFNKKTKESVWLDPRKKSRHSKKEHSNNFNSGGSGQKSSMPAKQSPVSSPLDKTSNTGQTKSNEANRYSESEVLKQVQSSEKKFEEMRLERASMEILRSSKENTQEAVQGEGEINNNLVSELQAYHIDLHKKQKTILEYFTVPKDKVYHSTKECAPDSHKLLTSKKFKSERRRKEAANETALVMTDVGIEEEIEGVMNAIEYVKEEYVAIRKAREEAIELKEGDYYSVLGLNRNATFKHLRVAYKKLLKTYHPDKRLNSTSRSFMLIQTAYETLSDDYTRKAYDFLGLEDYLSYKKRVECFQNYVKAGLLLKKHGRNGKRIGCKSIGITIYHPRSRFVWLDSRIENFCSAPVHIPEPKTEKEKESIKTMNIENIICITRGQCTEVLRRSGSSGKDSKYFSIISPERSLDLEASSKAQRDFLASRIELLTIHIQKDIEKLMLLYKTQPKLLSD